MRFIKISLGCLILISGIGFGQEANLNSSAISKNFSVESITVFQEKSQHKLIEFYEYLNLYSNEKDKELKNQIKKNILNLAESDIQIIDFTSQNSGLIDLNGLLSKIENKSYQFAVIEMGKTENLESHQWTNSYHLRVTKNDLSRDFKIHQTIHFEPKEKQFGKNTKLVWEMKLSNQIQ